MFVLPDAVYSVGAGNILLVCMHPAIVLYHCVQAVESMMSFLYGVDLYHLIKTYLLLAYNLLVNLHTLTKGETHVKYECYFAVLVLYMY